jgi:hypothetical protein
MSRGIKQALFLVVAVFVAGPVAYAASLIGLSLGSNSTSAFFFSVIAAAVFFWGVIAYAVITTIAAIALPKKGLRSIHRAVALSFASLALLSSLLALPREFWRAIGGTLAAPFRYMSANSLEQCVAIQDVTLEWGPSEGVLRLRSSAPEESSLQATLKFYIVDNPRGNDSISLGWSESQTLKPSPEGSRQVLRVQHGGYPERPKAFDMKVSCPEGMLTFSTHHPDERIWSIHHDHLRVWKRIAMPAPP